MTTQALSGAPLGFDGPASTVVLQFADHVQCATATIGTGSLTLGAATSGYQSFAQAVSNGQLTSGGTIFYTITDGANWECGAGVLTNATSLTRTVVSSSAGNAALLSLSGAAIVSLTLIAPFALTADAAAPLASPTFTGTVSLTGALQLTNATANTIYFLDAGVAPPSYTTPSIGEKLVLYPTRDSGLVDYAIGIDSGTLWCGLPAFGPATSFKWYGATTLAASLTGDGIFSASGGIDSTVIGVAGTGMWTQRQGVSQGNWNSVYYGGGLFVMVAYGTTATAVSDDAMNWTPHSLPSSENWTDITYGNGIFVTIAYNSAVAATSPDGVTWTQRVLPTSGPWVTVTYGAVGFLAVMQNATIMATSPDGITWTQRALPVSGAWVQVYFGNGAYLVFAANSTVLLKSVDGINWYQNALPSSSNWVSMTYGLFLPYVAGNLGLFVIIAQNSAIAATSPDGVTWTVRSLPASRAWVSVTYGNNLFLAVANGTTDAITSPDGINWSATPATGLTTLLGVIYGAGVYVAVAPNPGLGQMASSVYGFGVAAGVFATLLAPTPLAGDYSSQAATTEFATPAFSNIGRNRLFNSLLRIAQRGASWSSAGQIYTADRWMVNGTTTVTTALLTSTGYGPNNQVLSASMTATAVGNVINLGQRLEAADIVDLVGQTVVASCYASATLSAGTVTLAFVTQTPSISDNWGSTLTTITQGTVALTSTPTRLQVSFTVPSAASTGLMLFFQAIVATGSGTLVYKTSAFQLERGLTASAIEIKGIAHDWAECCRYYRRVSINARGPAMAANEYFDSTLGFEQMRATPTAALITLGTASNATASAATLSIGFNGSGRFEIVSTAAGDCYVLNQVYELAAEL